MYPLSFYKESISKIVGDDTPIIDGSKGTVQQLKRQLVKYDIVNKNTGRLGSVKIFNSMNSQDIIKLSYRLLREKIS